MVDSSGDIYLSSYYGTAVDKFSPTGHAAVVGRPAEGQSRPDSSPWAPAPTSSWWPAWSRTRRRAWSSTPSTGATSGTFPLVDRSGLRHPGGRRQPALSGNGYVETVSPTGQVLSTFGAPNIEGNDEHTGSGSQFYYPAQAVQGPDGTIYTADPLYTMEATSPAGFLQGSTTLGQRPRLRRMGLRPRGRHLLLPERPALRRRQPTPSPSFSLAIASPTYLDAIQAPSDRLGWGAGLATPATGNYFAPGTTPDRGRHLRPVVGLGGLATSSCPTRSRTTPPSTAETVPTAHRARPPDHGHRPRLHPARPSRRPTPRRDPTRCRPPCSTPPRHPPPRSGRPACPTPWARRVTASTSPPCRPVSAPAARPTPGAWPSTPSSASTGFRSRPLVDWSSVLPNCNASAPTAATCGPSAMTFASASTDPYKAAYLADQDHVAYWIQVSGGGRRCRRPWWTSGYGRATSPPWWPTTRRCPPGCGACAPVTMWEPWNESNNTGWSNGAHLRHPGARALLRRGEVGRAGHHVDGARRLDPRAGAVVVAAADRRRRPGLDGRGRHPPLHRLQRLLRGGRDARPGRAAPGAARSASRCGSPRSAGGATATTTSSARPTTWPGR